MSYRMRYRSLVLLGALAAVIAMTWASIAGQAPTASEKSESSTWTPPRTAWGDPDLQGIWRGIGRPPLERPKEFAGREFLTDDEVAAKVQALEERNAKGRAGELPLLDSAGLHAYNYTWMVSNDPVRVSRRTSAIIDPPTGRLPAWTPEQLKRWQAKDERTRGRGEADSWEDRSLSERCIWPVSTGLSAAKQILQSPGYVVIVMETLYAYEYRIVPLDGGPPLGPKIRQWQGDARGRWEGNTLVVEITNINDKQDGGPIITSHRLGGRPAGFSYYPGSGETLRVIERYTRTSPDTIEYRYTIDDPHTYTRPYTALNELTGDDRYMMLPGQCHEGNYGLGGQLAAARADEKTALQHAADVTRERQQHLKELQAEWATWKGRR